MRRRRKVEVTFSEISKSQVHNQDAEHKTLSLRRRAGTQTFRCEVRDEYYPGSTVAGNRISTATSTIVSYTALGINNAKSKAIDCRVDI